jgi:hypothetical protein
LLDLEVEPPKEPQPGMTRPVGLGDIPPIPKPLHVSNWTNPEKKPSEILSGVPMKKKREDLDKKKELMII